MTDAVALRNDGPDAERAVGPSERLLLATVVLGGVLAPLNSTMIAVALPDIRSDFTLSHAAIGWLISSYLITMAIAQPVAGSLGTNSVAHGCCGSLWSRSWRRRCWPQLPRASSCSWSCGLHRLPPGPR